MYYSMQNDQIVIITVSPPHSAYSFLYYFCCDEFTSVAGDFPHEVQSEPELVLDLIYKEETGVVPGVSSLANIYSELYPDIQIWP